MIRYNQTYLIFEPGEYKNFDSPFVNIRPLYYGGEPSSTLLYVDEPTIQQQDDGVWWIHFPADKYSVKKIPFMIDRFTIETAIDEFNIRNCPFPKNVFDAFVPTL